MKDGFDSVKVIDRVSGDVSVHARVWHAQGRKISMGMLTLGSVADNPDVSLTSPGCSLIPTPSMSVWKDGGSPW